jgi:hypothetical protein
MADSYLLLLSQPKDLIANSPINFRFSMPFALMRRYEFENAVILIRSAMSRLFNIEHFQNQRGTAVFWV